MNPLSRTRTRIALGLLSTLVAVSMAAGCSLSSGEDASGNGTSAACSPSDGGTIALATSGTVNSFDPNLNGIVTLAYLSVADAVTEPLLRMSPDGASVENVLAESLEPSADGRRWTVKLRQGVKFSDGSQLDAADVEFSFRWLEHSSYAQLYTNVEEYRIVDDLTLELVLKEPSAQFGDVLAAGSYTSPVFPSDFGGLAAKKYFAAPIGTGPYLVDKFVPDRQVTLKRNATYWGERGHADTITFEFVGDPGTRVNGLRGGTYDIADRIPWDQAKNLGAGVEYYERPSSTVDILMLNPANELAMDPAVRRAIQQVVDRDGISAAAYAGHAKPLYAMTSSIIPDAVEPSSSVQHDASAAAATMAASAHPDGGSMEMVYDLGDPAMKLEVQILQQSLAEIGIKVDPVPLGTAEYYDRVLAGKFDLLLVRFEQVVPSIYDNVYTYVNFGGYFGWPTPAVEQQVAELNSATTAAGRGKVAVSFEDFVAEQGGQVPLVNVPWNAARVSSVGGMAISPFQTMNLASLYRCGS